MSLFSRRARWLNIFFPQSVAPAVQDPGILSDDVSLVQPYDGGAYPLVEPTDWLRFTILPVGATGSTVVATTGAEEMMRFLAADVYVLAGMSPSGTVLRAVPPTGGGGDIFVAQRLSSISTLGTPFITHTPVIGPQTQMSVTYEGGNATTQLLVHIYGVIAPLGSVFRV